MDDTRRKWIRSTLWIGLAGAALWWWFNAQQRIGVVPADQAPPASILALRAPSGETYELGSLGGRVVVVNLWASWCGPCLTEIPRLNRLQTELGDRGLAVVGINVESLADEQLGRLGRSLGIEFAVASPARPLQGTAFAGEGAIPHTWLVDRHGRLRASKAGLVTERSLRSAVLELLAEPWPQTPGQIRPDDDA